MFRCKSIWIKPSAKRTNVNVRRHKTARKRSLPSPCRCPSRPPRLSQTPPQTSPHGSMPRYGRRGSCPWSLVGTTSPEPGPVSWTFWPAQLALCSGSIGERIEHTHTHKHTQGLLEHMHTSNPNCVCVWIFVGVCVCVCVRVCVCVCVSRS